MKAIALAVSLPRLRRVRALGRVGFAAAGLIFLGAVLPAMAETPEQWVSLGERIHGAFGSYIALGIRIGQDASERLQAKPRDLEVVLIQGPNSPCPCLADGLMLSTYATPGRGTLRIADEKATADQLAIVVVRSKESGETLRYIVPDALRTKLDEWNRKLQPIARYHAMFEQPEAGLFTRGVLEVQPEWSNAH